MVFRYYPPDEIPRPPPRPVEEGLLIGHFSLGYERAFFDDCDRVVFLREPVSRLASQALYDRRYFLRRPSSPHGAWFQAGGDPFEFIDQSRFWYYDNAMVRMLSGIGERAGFGEITSAHLDLAIANLKTFGFIGVQERFGVDMSVLMSRYDWRGRIPRINSSEERVNLNARLIERLSRFNRFDHELYDYVVRIREER